MCVCVCVCVCVNLLFLTVPTPKTSRVIPPVTQKHNSIPT